MLRVVSIAALALVTGLAGRSSATGPVWDAHAAHPAYAAPACGAPMYGLAPGCCECVPNCCTNVWDGYCREPGRFFGMGGGLAAMRGCRQCAPHVIYSEGAGSSGGARWAPVETAPPLTPAMGRRVPNPRLGVPRAF